MSTNRSRRDFLAEATGAAALVAGSSAWHDPSRAGSQPAADPDPDDDAVPIVDTHVHLWDLRRFRLPWLNSAGSLDRSFLWEDYRKASEGLNVVKAVYMEVDVDPPQQSQEAESIVELIGRRDTSLVAAVISGRPASDDFENYLKPLRRSPAIKGVRQVLHGPGTPAGTCLEPRFVKGIQLLGTLGLSFDLCLRATDLGDGARLAEACPDTTFILDHCGNPDVFGPGLDAWRRDLAKVSARPNVSCKVSGIVASTKGRPWSAHDLAPIINHVLTEFGPDRVLFGGDWPVCTLGAPLARWVEALREVVKDRSLADRRKLFHDNAVKVYRLA